MIQSSFRGASLHDSIRSMRLALLLSLLVPTTVFGSGEAEDSGIDSRIIPAATAFSGGIEAPHIHRDVQSGDLPLREERLPPDENAFEDSDSSGQYLPTIRIIGLGSVSDVDCDGHATPARAPRSISVDERLTLLTTDGYFPNLARLVEPKKSSEGVDVWLRQSKWSDGTPVTASDIVFSLEVISYGVVQPLMRYIDTQPTAREVLDDHVEINFGSSVSDVEFLLNQIEIYPAHTAEPFLKKLLKDGVESDSWASKFRFCARRAAISPILGPYVFESYDGHRTVLYRANPYYFKIDRNGRQQPYFEHVVYYVAEDLATLEAHAMAAAIDVPLIVELPPDAIHAVESLVRTREGLKIEIHKRSGRGSAAAYFFNCHDSRYGSLFQSYEFRRATLYALDRQQLVDVVYRPSITGVRPQTSIVHWNGYDIGDEHRYDIDAARDLLSQVSDDGHLQFSISVAEEDHLAVEVAAIVAMGWEALDIEATVRPVPRDELKSSEHSHEYQVILRSFYIPESLARTYPGVLVSPYLDNDIWATEREHTDEQCHPHHLLAAKIQDWHIETRGLQSIEETYRVQTAAMLREHQDMLLTIGLVSPLPDIDVVGKELSSLRNKIRSGAETYFVPASEN